MPGMIPIIDDDGREVHAICATADVRDTGELPPTCKPTWTECPLCKNNFRNMPPHCRMRGTQGTPRTDAQARMVPDSVPIAGRFRFNGQATELVSAEFARELEREVERISASHKALMANADERYDELHAEVLELQRQVAAKNKPAVCYSNCAMHKHVPWQMKVTVMTGTVATVCPICHPPEQSV